ncbi:putative woronin body major protein [Rosellinia necatrix]|uniref:Putative woronin body major protein n=1 Tax=Rosellinia necatrix TaxID=77044 RepID=A0A1W2TIP4_ROSNE|nr:putative woronin body major protein [Rosellinia necatrix]
MAGCSYKPANVNVFHETRNSYQQVPRPASGYAVSSYTESSVEVDKKHKPHYSALDRIEREYRARVQPSVYREEVRVTGATVDTPAPRPQFDSSVPVTGATVDTPSHIPHYADKVSFTEETVDVSKPAAASYHKDVKTTEETVEYPRHSSAYQKSRMGYYDEEGHYHSFRHGLHKMADRIFHPEGERTEVIRETHHVSHSPAPRPSSSGGSGSIPNTVTIPCHHIRMGDILMLQGRPCQVIRISTSSATGQHRYLGVDLFSKQLHEESSFVSNPAPSVVVQTMLGPVFKQYRVLDIQNGSVTAMTESGDVKTGLPVIDQSGLYSRLTTAFQQGHGSVRVLVLNDHGSELVVDVKVVHGSRL